MERGEEQPRDGIIANTLYSTAEALKAGDEEEAYQQLLNQSNFLTDHLAAWAPMLTADMKRFAKSELYQGLAYLTDGFLETDTEFLEDVLDS